MSWFPARLRKNRGSVPSSGGTGPESWLFVRDNSAQAEDESEVNGDLPR